MTKPRFWIRRSSGDLVSVTNQTKWREVRDAMYGLGPDHPLFQRKELGERDPWEWDGEWYYHFRLPDYRSMEWVDIRAESPRQRELIRERLRPIHVPGEETETGFRVYGWVKPSQAVDWIG